MTNHTTWHDFLDAVDSAWPVSRFRDVGVVVGCSGGADSVALLRSLAELVRRDSPETSPRGFLVAAHFDHGHRGQQSQGDADFVRDLGDQLDIVVEIASGNLDRRDEETARNQRRAFFLDVLRKRGARYLALGHSLDDNVETVLQRLFRGTGPLGLTGIAPFRPLADCPAGNDFVVARPMLAVARQQIREALRSQQFPWREDASNRSNEYRRNWIRNELIPMIRSQFPDATRAIGRAIDGQRQWQQVLHPHIEHWIDTFRIQCDPLTLRRLDRSGDDELSVRGPELDADATLSGKAITIEALRRCWLQSGWPLQSMGRSHWSAIYDLLSGRGPDAMTLPGSIDARRDQQCVRLFRRPLTIE